MVVKSKAVIPLIINSGKKISIIQTKAMLIIIVKNPRVIILKGRAMSFKMGFKKKLTKPSAIPAKSKIWISPVKITPETNLIASHNPKIPETICRKSSFTIIVVYQKENISQIFDKFFLFIRIEYTTSLKKSRSKILKFEINNFNNY